MAAPVSCKRCGRPVETDAALASDVFEGMHWLCFHLEFEHPGDPDLPCMDPSCHALRRAQTSPVPSAAQLALEAKRATAMLKGRVVAQVSRHRPKEVGVQFADGTRLFVDHQSGALELSITAGASKRSRRPKS